MTAVNLRFVPLRLHAAVDYLVPVTFIGVPSLFGFPSDARAVAFAFGGAHLSMTLLTDYPGGLLKLIPLSAHLLAELLLGPALVVMPWLLDFSSDRLATALFVVWGVFSVATYFVTNRTVPA